MKEMDRQIILIGYDDEKMLSSIQFMKKKNVCPIIIVIKNTNLVASIHCKGIQKYYRCGGEDEAILTLISEFERNKDSVLLCPTSKEIEKRVQALKQFKLYLLPFLEQEYDSMGLRYLKFYRFCEKIKIIKLGFQEVKKLRIKRFLKHNINKEKIRGTS